MRLFGTILLALVFVAKAVPAACCVGSSPQKKACCSACPYEVDAESPLLPTTCPPTCSAGDTDLIPPTQRAVIEVPADVLPPQSGILLYLPTAAAETGPHVRSASWSPPPANVPIHLMNCVLRR